MKKIFLLVFLVITLNGVSQQSYPRFLYLPGIYSLHMFGEERSLFATGDSIELSLDRVGDTLAYMIRGWSRDLEATIDDSTGSIYLPIGKWNYIPYASDAEYVDGYFMSWDLEDSTKFQASWNCYNELQLYFKGKLLIKRR